MTLILTASHGSSEHQKQKQKNYASAARQSTTQLVLMVVSQDEDAAREADAQAMFHKHIRDHRCPF